MPTSRSVAIKVDPSSASATSLTFWRIGLGLRVGTTPLTIPNAASNPSRLHRAFMRSPPTSTQVWLSFSWLGLPTTSGVSTTGVFPSGDPPRRASDLNHPVLEPDRGSPLSTGLGGLRLEGDRRDLLQVHDPEARVLQVVHDERPEAGLMGHE